MSEINLDDIEDIYDSIVSDEEPDSQEEIEQEEPEQEEEAAEPVEVGDEPEEEDEESEESETPKSEPEYIAPPPTWRAKAKAKWDTLDPEIKEEVLKRESEGLRGVNAVKEKASFGDRINSTIAPYQPFLSKKNLAPERVISDALNLAYSLETSDPKAKAAILMNIAVQYGADLEAFKGDIPKPDPIQQELATLKQYLAAQQQRLESSEEEKVVQAITDFASEKDNGKPRYPYFSNVEEEMISIIPLVKRRHPNLSYKEVLVKAYNEAVWTNPETRQLLIADKAKEEARQRQERNKDILARAEKNKRSNFKSRPKDEKPDAKPIGTIDQTMNEIYDSITA